MCKQKPMDISKIVESRGLVGNAVEYKGVIYFGENSSYFRAVDAKTGKELWSVKVGNVINTSVYVDDGCLYFGSHDKCVYCVSLGGEILWRFMSGGIVNSLPQVYGDVVYFGSCDGNFYALSKNRGEEIWRFSAGSEVIGDPVVSHDRIYFGTIEGKVCCIDLFGNVVWEYQTGDGIINGQCVIHDNIIYVGSTDQSMYALSLENGLPVWRFWTGDMVHNKALYHEGVLYFGSRDSHLYAVDAKTGRELWKYRTEYPISSKPVIKGERIYLGSDKIYCLTFSGEMIDEYPIGDTVVAAPLILDDGIMFACMDGVVRKLTFDLELIWDIKSKSSVFAPFLGLFKPTNMNPDFLERRAEKMKNQNKSALEQEMEFYELREGAKGGYGGGSLAGEAPEGVSLGLYGEGCSGSGSLYSQAKNGGVYGAGKEHAKEDGFDDKGKILKKFIWE